LEFDYDKMRLAKLLAVSSKIPNAPMLHIDFALKDIEAKERELISVAYEDAKKKAEALVIAANKNLRDCVRVEIDHVSQDMKMGGMMPERKMLSSRPGLADDFEQQIKNIDDTFKPDDITLSKEISCVWETSN